MILIGLTGTIGSGKTFALSFFKSKKIKVFSADVEVKKILENKIVKEKIYKLFPGAFVGKKLNKNSLASIVFSDKKKLRKLEKIIHPRVRKEKKKFLDINKNKNFIIMEIPIIFEQKTKKNYDYIILMDVNKKTQFERIKKRKSMTKELFKKILANQISNKKKKFANFIINNNGSKLRTRRILKKTLDKIISTEL